MKQSHNKTFQNETKYYNSKEFRQLKALWYEKLKLSGFEDIETEYESIKKPMASVAYAFKKETKEHFERVRQYLQHGAFEAKHDEFIWEEYSQGKTVREIARLMRSRRFKRQSKSFVALRIAAMNARMNKLKLWERTELPVHLN